MREILAPILSKLNQLKPLEPADKEAFLKMPCRIKEVDSGQVLIDEGIRTVNCIGLLSGFAYSHQILQDGKRQIISVHIPGDFPDLKSAILGKACDTLQMLSPGRIALFNMADVQRLLTERPAIQTALWRETLVTTSIVGEWLTNVGRRDARGRISHHLCEFAVRLRFAGLLEGNAYEFPLTQEQIADATGLTVVHVNRTLQDLRRAGVIRTKRRAVQIVDWQRLVQLSDFSPRYLHGKSEMRQGDRPDQ